jgi:hypothetical protein
MSTQSQRTTFDGRGVDRGARRRPVGPRRLDHSEEMAAADHDSELDEDQQPRPLIPTGFRSQPRRRPPTMPPTSVRAKRLSEICDHDENLTSFVRWILSRHAKLGGVTEVRAIAERPCKMVWSGYFDAAHWEQVVELIRPEGTRPRTKIPYGGSPLIGEANFYFTMQAVKPALLARSDNEFTRCQATTDHDILGYHLFAVDVDPVRPSGISATNEEKTEAEKVAVGIQKWLRKRGIDWESA